MSFIGAWCLLWWLLFHIHQVIDHVTVRALQTYLWAGIRAYAQDKGLAFHKPNLLDINVMMTFITVNFKCFTLAAWCLMLDACYRDCFTCLSDHWAYHAFSFARKSHLIRQTHRFPLETKGLRYKVLDSMLRDSRIGSHLYIDNRLCVSPSPASWVTLAAEVL